MYRDFLTLEELKQTIVADKTVSTEVNASNFNRFPLRFILTDSFDDCFKRQDGTYIPFSDYVEWLGLVSLCEGIESDGIYECRVVFAFDN